MSMNNNITSPALYHTNDRMITSIFLNRTSSSETNSNSTRVVGTSSIVNEGRQSLVGGTSSIVNEGTHSSVRSTSSILDEGTHYHVRVNTSSSAEDGTRPLSRGNTSSVNEGSSHSLELSQLLNENKIIMKALDKLISTTTSPSVNNSITPSKKVPGLILTSHDLPRFQVKYLDSSYGQFEGRKEFETVNQFLLEFEETIASAKHDIESCWKIYMPVCLSDKIKPWMRKELFLCKNWMEAKETFIEAFRPDWIRQAYHQDLTNAKMQPNQTLLGFYHHFLQLVENCEHVFKEQTLSYIFLGGLPDPVKFTLKMVMAGRKQQQENEDLTVTELYKIASSIYKNKKASEIHRETNQAQQHLDNQARRVAGGGPQKRRRQNNRQP